MKTVRAQIWESVDGQTVKQLHVLVEQCVATQVMNRLVDSPLFVVRIYVFGIVFDQINEHVQDWFSDRR